MAKGEYRRPFDFNPLAEEEGSQQMVQADQQSYHSIKTYNDTKDNITTRKNGILLLESLAEMPLFLSLLKSEMMTAHNIWLGINYQWMQKKGLKPDSSDLLYKGEFKTDADQIQKLIGFIQTPLKFVHEDGTIDADYEKYAMLPDEAKVALIKETVEETVQKLSEDWAIAETKINFGIPMSVKAPRNPFLSLPTQ